jgi:hypothetical protein
MLFVCLADSLCESGYANCPRCVFCPSEKTGTRQGNTRQHQHQRQRQYRTRHRLCKTGEARDKSTQALLSLWRKGSTMCRPFRACLLLQIVCIFTLSFISGAQNLVSFDPAGCKEDATDLKSCTYVVFVTIALNCYVDGVDPVRTCSMPDSLTCLVLVLSRACLVIVLSCLVSSRLVLYISCLALPCLALPCLALPCLALSFHDFFGVLNHLFLYFVGTSRLGVLYHRSHGSGCENISACATGQSRGASIPGTHIFDTIESSMCVQQPTWTRSRAHLYPDHNRRGNSRG